MPVVTSIINLKGGVGKTTLTLALANYLTGEHSKRVLVIDLDPQTNATIAMVNERRWRERDQSGQTLYQLFRDQLEGTRTFNARDAIITRVSNIGGGMPGLDLLPASIRLHRIQDKITKVADLDSYRDGQWHRHQQVFPDPRRSGYPLDAGRAARPRPHGRFRAAGPARDIWVGHRCLALSPE